MYFCKRCNAEFEEPLDGTCPACGASSRHFERYDDGPAYPTEDVVYGPPEPPSRPAARPSGGSRPYGSGGGGGGGSSSGVFGPPKHTGSSESSRKLRSRAAGCGPFFIGLVLLMVIGAAVTALVFVSDDCDMDTGSDYEYEYTETIENEEPLWRDRRAEMIEAGYEPVANVDPDLWPVVGYTLWFVDDVEGTLWYMPLGEDQATLVQFSPAADYIGDIHPVDNGGGVLAVMDLGGVYGVYMVGTAGQAELLVEAAELAAKLKALKYMPDGFYAGVDAALTDRELLVSPRISEDGRFLAVGVGPVDDTRVMISPNGAEPYVLDRYTRNSWPTCFAEGRLYVECLPGETHLLRSFDLNKDGYELHTPSFQQGEYVTNGELMAYVSEDGGRPAVRFGYIENPYEAQVITLPEGPAECVSLAADQLICILTRIQSQDGFLFRHIDNPDAESFYPLYFNRSRELRSGYLGPPLSEPGDK